MQNQGIIFTRVRNFAHPSNQIRTPRENRPTPTKSFRSLCEIFADYTKNFVHPNPFHTLCEILRGLLNHFAALKAISYIVRKLRGACENEKSPVYLFLNLPSPKILISQTPHILRIPHFSLPPYDFTPLHSISSLACISLRRDALRVPSEHRPKARLPFPTWHEPEEPFSPLHRDAPRGREPPLLRYLAIPHLRPRRPRAFHLKRMERPLVLHHLLLSAGTRRGNHLLFHERLLCTPRAQYGALQPKGPGFQAQASHLEL